MKSIKLAALLLAVALPAHLRAQVSSRELGETCRHVELVGGFLDNAADSKTGVCDTRLTGGAGGDEQECYGGDLFCAGDNTVPPSPEDGTPSDTSKTPNFVDPITGDGEFFTTVTDLSYPGFGIKFEFNRSYRSRSTAYGPLGHNWDHS